MNKLISMLCNQAGIAKSCNKKGINGETSEFNRLLSVLERNQNRIISYMERENVLDKSPSELFIYEDEEVTRSHEIAYDQMSAIIHNRKNIAWDEFWVLLPEAKTEKQWTTFDEIRASIYNATNLADVEKARQDAHALVNMVF